MTCSRTSHLNAAKRKPNPSISIRSRVISSTMDGLLRNHQQPKGKRLPNFRVQTQSSHWFSRLNTLIKLDFESSPREYCCRQLNSSAVMVVYWAGTIRTQFRCSDPAALVDVE